MVGSQQAVESPHARVRLVAQPTSVPAARRFVDEQLTRWDCVGLVDDVGLCVSELVTNSTLHSGSLYFQLEVEKCPPSVRVTVTDAGMGSVEVLARQPELSGSGLDDLVLDDPCTTGHGMFLVSALASAWGIDELPEGKRVWADFPLEPASGPDPEPSTPLVTRSEERQAPAPDPESWTVVRFLDCPAALLVAHDENLAAYTRELQLIGERLAEPAYQRLAASMSEYVADHAANWDPARILAHNALRAGRELVDIDVLAPRDVRESLRALRALVDEAEALSRQDRLMTLPAPEPVQRLRDWLVEEFVAQVHDGADPLPYPDWAAGARR